MINQIIIPIMNGGSGPNDPLAYLAMWIFLNAICFSIFFIRAIIWFIKKPQFSFGYKTIYKNDKIPFFDYCSWSDSETSIDLNTIVWISINVFALLTYDSWFVYHLMGGTLPFN